MTMQFQEQAKVIKAEHLTHDIVRLTLQAPQIVAAALPGQFVMVRAAEGMDPLLRRPFSLHQVTSSGWLQILFKVLGKGTHQLASIEEDGVLDLVGPLGHGFNLEGKEKFCLVGGGMGIAPMYYLAKDLLHKAEPEQILVLLGSRTADELKQLLNDFNGLGVNLRVATDDGSMGHHGFVHELMIEHMLGDPDWQVCTCGPHPMMQAVVKLCKVNNWKCQVSLETMMACGIGACLGCAIPAADLTGDYLHVCKDGPVFAAEEVAWF